MDLTANATPTMAENDLSLTDKKAKPKTAREVVFDVSTGISNAILAVLGMGLLMSSLGNLFHYTPLIQAGLMG